MRKIWPLPGGIELPENKHQSLDRPLRIAPLSARYCLPLSQHLGAAAKACVQPGEPVRKYQIIATADGPLSANLHAPTSGVITAIAPAPVPHPSGLEADCIWIESDGRDEALPLTTCANPLALAPEAALAKLGEAGIVGLGGAGFPTRVKLSPKAGRRIHTLIINGTECEPYITADDILMQTRPQAVIQGIQLLAHLLGEPDTVLIGVEDNKPKAIAALRQAAQGTRIEVVSFPTRYPSGGEKQLIYILTGQEVPSGGLPADLGLLVQNVGTAAAIWDALAQGKPLIERITTFTGLGLAQPQNIQARIGTPLSDLLSLCGYRVESAAKLIMGGPMMGFELPHAALPLIKTTNCILVPGAHELSPPSEPSPCIRCGHCSEACPAGLLPQQLLWYAQAGDHDRLMSHSLFDCIECGACAYVCPSEIPLVQHYRAAKGEIRAAAADKQKADHARVRFEQRQARIALQEAEKEAKRLERQRVADENKARLAMQATTPADTSSRQLASPSRAAPTDGAQPLERERLERTLASLQARLQLEHAKLQSPPEPLSEAQQDKLRAQIKQTEQKIQDSHARLAALGTASPSPAAQPLSGAALTPDHLLAQITSRLEQAEARWRAAVEAQSPAATALAATVSTLQLKRDEQAARLAAWQAAQPEALTPARNQRPASAPTPASTQTPSSTQTPTP